MNAFDTRLLIIAIIIIMVINFTCIFSYKVQLAKKLVPLERVRKLVDEYVILHKQYTETKKDTV